MNLLRNDLPVGVGSIGFDVPIQRPMDSMLEDFFSPYALNPSAAWRAPLVPPSPRIDVMETDKAFEIEAELPGVSKDDVKVAVHNRRVTIEAEVKREGGPKEDENIVYAERSIRKFSRSFALPAEIDDENAQAKLENGILTLTLPKKEATQAKTIAIQ